MYVNFCFKAINRTRINRDLMMNGGACCCANVNSRENSQEFIHKNHKAIDFLISIWNYCRLFMRHFVACTDLYSRGMSHASLRLVQDLSRQVVQREITIQQGFYCV